jgi:hypothetical protein
VRDPGGLKVEVGDHGIVRATRESSTWLAWGRRRRLLRRGDTLPRRGMEEALRLGDLASKTVSSGTLVLPGDGGHTHALLSGGNLGLGSLKSRSHGTVGGGDDGGARRHTPEEGGGGERSSRRRHSQAAERSEPWEERDTSAAEQ